MDSRTFSIGEWSVWSTADGSWWKGTTCALGPSYPTFEAAVEAAKAAHDAQLRFDEAADRDPIYPGRNRYHGD